MGCETRYSLRVLAALSNILFCADNEADISDETTTDTWRNQFVTKSYNHNLYFWI